jgi:hypothetical protein
MGKPRRGWGGRSQSRAPLHSAQTPLASSQLCTYRLIIDCIVSLVATPLNCQDNYIQMICDQDTAYACS